jgi:hypothetical protein
MYCNNAWPTWPEILFTNPRIDLNTFKHPSLASTVAKWYCLQ